MKPIRFLTGKIMSHISALGTGTFLILLILIALLWGRSALFWQLFIGIIIVYAIISPIKWFFHRERPDKQRHHNWMERYDASTFPSAHANRSALIFIVFSVFFGRWSMAILFLAISLVVSYSRVYLGRHYWKDVVVGYILGLVEGVLVVIFV